MIGMDKECRLKSIGTSKTAEFKKYEKIYRMDTNYFLLNILAIFFILPICRIIPG